MEPRTGDALEAEPEPTDPGDPTATVAAFSLVLVFELETEIDLLFYLFCKYYFIGVYDNFTVLLCITAIFDIFPELWEVYQLIKRQKLRKCHSKKRLAK